MKNVAYIFEDVSGWYICDEDGELDTRGACYPTKNQAIASLRDEKRFNQTDYTHYTTGLRTRPAKL